jgi:hypothetical protein
MPLHLTYAMCLAWPVVGPHVQPCTSPLLDTPGGGGGSSSTTTRQTENIAGMNLSEFITSSRF